MNRQLLETIIERINSLWFKDLEEVFNGIKSKNRTILFKAIYDYIEAKELLYNTKWEKEILFSNYEKAKRAVLSCFKENINKEQVLKLLKVLNLTLYYLFNVYIAMSQNKITFHDFINKEFDIHCMGLQILVIELLKNIEEVVYGKTFKRITQ